MSGIKISNILKFRNTKFGVLPEIDPSYPVVPLDLKIFSTVAPNVVAYAICWSPQLEMYVAASPANYMAYSYDGIEWFKSVSSQISSNAWYSVCWSKELRRFVAVAYGGAAIRIIYSDNGIDWSSANPLPTATFAFHNVCWSGEQMKFVAAVYTATGASINMLYSSDGIDWYAADCPTSGMICVVWAKKLNKFVALSHSGRIVLSTDGITWTQVSTSVSGSWHGMSWSEELGRLVILAHNSSTQKVAYSDDGLVWNWSTTPSSINSFLLCGSLWSKELGMFMLVAYNGGKALAYSEDGITWSYTEGTATIPNSVAAIVFSPKHNAIVGAGLSKMVRWATPL